MRDKDRGNKMKRDMRQKGNQRDIKTSYNGKE